MFVALVLYNVGLIFGELSQLFQGATSPKFHIGPSVNDLARPDKELKHKSKANLFWKTAFNLFLFQERSVYG